MTDTVNTAVTPVDSVTLAGSATTSIDMSIMGMFWHADTLVKIVMLMLIAASFWSWAIIIDKHFRFKTIKAKTNKFEQDFWSSEALDKFHDTIKKRANHPIAILFMAAMDEWFRARVRNVSMMDLSARQSLTDRINHVMQVTRNRELDTLESGLGFLATVGSTAPFVGLFGTVWGIMHSFQSIAASKNTSLVVVAPGIAEALFATAIGLFAAIPAVIFYNKFSNELNRLTGKLEDFSTEFNTLLSRQFDTKGS